MAKCKHCSKLDYGFVEKDGQRSTMYQDKEGNLCHVVDTVPKNMVEALQSSYKILGMTEHSIIRIARNFNIWVQVPSKEQIRGY